MYRPVRACTANTSDSSYGLCAKNYPKAYLNASTYPPGTFDKKYNLCCPTKADFDAGYTGMGFTDKAVYAFACPSLVDKTAEFCRDAYVKGSAQAKARAAFQHNQKMRVNQMRVNQMRANRMRACTASTSDAAYGVCNTKYPKAYLNASIYPPGTFDKKYNICCPTETDYIAGYKAMAASDKAVYIAGCPPIDEALTNFCSTPPV